MKYDNVLFVVDSRTNGIYGRKYKNAAEAIAHGSYSPWDNNKIKRAFQFGNGTMKDFRRYCKDNLAKVLTAGDFFKILNRFSVDERAKHMKFIDEVLQTFA